MIDFRACELVTVWEGRSWRFVVFTLTIIIMDELFHHVAALNFHELEQPTTKSQDSVSFHYSFVDLVHS